MTHSEKVLRLLSDGKPHTHMEGYRLGVMLHSRVADLRKRGYEIDCWREGEFYVYQMVRAGDKGADGDSLSAAPCPDHRADASKDGVSRFSCPTPARGLVSGTASLFPSEQRVEQAPVPVPRQLTVWDSR